ncbi:MAG: cytochrome c biogenesis heme-transporting ATPase CcmA [Gammaproteobacteria bacterium]|nr:cytochrome c biogenesis heme-transporting ATPase CcmA [Gammaproteobacteria bacterium]
MLGISDLECVRGDRRLFSGLSFGLASGSVLHIHGPNGSGKTTLLRTIAGLVLPEHGRIEWNGQEIRKLGEEFHRELLYLGHLPGLKYELTGYENLKIFGGLSGFEVTEAAVEAALKRMGLARCVDLPVKVLSQGQKRRVALARLLLQPAKLWILDEPFVALDVTAVNLLQEIIAEHVAKSGMVMLTTHQEVTLSVGSVQHLHLNS